MYGCCGRREGLLHGPALDDLAGVHHRDLVDHLRHDAEVVGDQEDRHPELLAEVLHQLEDLGLHGDVERGRRLVGDQELRVAAQRHADHHALAHAAGHLVRVVAHPLLGGRDPDEPHHLERARLRLLVADVLVEPDRLGDLLADREDRVERGHRLLEDHRDVVAADLRHLVLVERRRGRWPSKMMFELASTRPGASTSLMIESAVTDLPLPDSPTTPSVPPFGIEKSTPSTARIRPPWVWKPGAEVLDREQVASRLRLSRRRLAARLRGGALRALRRSATLAGPARRCASRAAPSITSGSRVCSAASRSRCSSTIRFEVLAAAVAEEVGADPGPDRAPDLHRVGLAGGRDHDLVEAEVGLDVLGEVVRGGGLLHQPDLLAELGELLLRRSGRARA